jgi:hypothetical protein
MYACTYKKYLQYIYSEAGKAKYSWAMKNFRALIFKALVLSNSLRAQADATKKIEKCQHFQKIS